MNYREEKVFKAHEYEIEITGDQSATLRPEKKESMHHMGGAAGESIYLYYQALEHYFGAAEDRESSAQLDILSFGFGMGYNEILTVLFFMCNKISLLRLRLYSYEKDLFLYSLFNDWLSEDTDSQSIFDNVYKNIELALASTESDFPAKKMLKSELLNLLEKGTWNQNGPVYAISDFKNERCDVVFYDAYSSKTCDYLWTEDFLNQFFEKHLKPKSVFSTYACTGALKRVSGAHQCQFIKRDGYSGKRNSSLISRL